MAASTQPHNPTCHRKSAGYPGKTADYPAVDPRSSSQIKPDSDITFNFKETTTRTDMNHFRIRVDGSTR